MVRICLREDADLSVREIDAPIYVAEGFVQTGSFEIFRGVTPCPDEFGSIETKVYESVLKDPVVETSASPMIHLFWIRTALVTELKSPTINHGPSSNMFSWFFSL